MYFATIIKSNLIKSLTDLLEKLNLKICKKLFKTFKVYSAVFSPFYQVKINFILHKFPG